ncbi:MAG: adenosylmethionine--8-amino-7-oxononanoate transaminase [Parashewanella sp.]
MNKDKQSTDHSTSRSSEWDFEFDRNHIWHPYTSMTQQFPVVGVQSADACELTLNDGTKLIDGLSSWWACVHGYNHPAIIEAMQQQLQTLSHVMFGGITHQPAINVSKRLVDMTCPSLTKVFLADSGSIAVEVALKMALQFWQGSTLLDKAKKQKIMTVKHGYHGDTFAAMSVCDPDNGMHTMFGDAVTQQVFINAPTSAFGEQLSQQDKQTLRTAFERHHRSLAAMIIEPILQGAGGMFTYSSEYLHEVRKLCDEFDVLLIVDEIATGFGRTGKLFAYEHAQIEPDLLCVGKALTGGYISLAATLCSDKVAEGISHSPSGVFMHGPTFMGNPLACAAADASLSLIQANNWQQQVTNIEQQLMRELAGVEQLSAVKQVRILGAMGVIEMNFPLNAAQLQPLFIKHGVWLRVFGNVIYTMPPYIISSKQLSQITHAMKAVTQTLSDNPLSEGQGFISHG